MAYQHPYHPEPWTPESPILLLLSRFSHASDPSAALVSSGVMPGLLYYLTQHQDPSSRCLRMLCRLSCNPNCLQALVRTGSVALIHHHLCQRGGGLEGDEGQTDRVKAKVKQLGVSLLNNLRVQCESGFGSGVVAHVMLSGSESDKVNCALSLPLISSNKSQLKRLLLDSGGLLLALQPLCCDEDEADEDHPDECGRLLSDMINPPHSGLTSRLRSLYLSLLIGCLSALTSGMKTELDKKNFGPVRTPAASSADRASPPPVKKPRLGGACPYGVSTFDLVLLLDDGTCVQAGREAVAEGEGTLGVGSEYFRALLRGGFGEARGHTEDAIRIKDVSAGMLLPVLHYLHGCRLDDGTVESDAAERRGRCRVLDALALEGPEICRNNSAFQRTALGEAMIGASRFLVTALQRDLEDLCVSLLLSLSARAAGGAAEDGDQNAAAKTESVEENLANRTSELELTGFEAQTERFPGEAKRPNVSPHRTDTNRASLVGTVQRASGGIAAASAEPIKTVAPLAHKSLDPEEFSIKPKTSTNSSAALSALLPQAYWFSQRYCYPALGRGCLSLLVGCLDRPRPFPSTSLAGDCLCRLAREADCTETLKRDLLSLAALALS